MSARKNMIVTKSNLTFRAILSNMSRLVFILLLTFINRYSVVFMTLICFIFKVWLILNIITWVRLCLESMGATLIIFTNVQIPSLI